MTHHSMQKQLYDYLHMDLAPGMQQNVEQHLADCAVCNAELQSLRSTLELFSRPSSSPADSREPEFWERFGAEIVEQIAGREPARNGWRNSIHEFVHNLIVPQQRFLVSAGAAIAVAGVLVLGWNVWLHHPAEESSSSGPPPEQVAVGEDPLGQYFRRSKVLLVGMSNLRTAAGTPVDLTAERSASRELIREARTFADRPLDPRSALLLRDLQKILIELANMEQTADIPNVEIIRGGIRQENLLFKIRMAEATRDSVRLMQAKYSF